MADISSTYENYNFYENVLRFGNYPTDFQNSSLGCRNDISINQAVNLCNTHPSADCDSFFVYDSENRTRVCFKNNMDITKNVRYHNDNRYPNSGMYVKKMTITCGEWDAVSGQDCGSGQIINDPTFIGNDASTCCRDISCGEWDAVPGQDCGSGKIINDPTSIGNDASTCCRDITCGEWDAISGQDCGYGKIIDDQTVTGSDVSTCCRDITCGEWINIYDEDCGDRRVIDDLSVIGSDVSTCCLSPDNILLNIDTQEISPYFHLDSKSCPLNDTFLSNDPILEDYPFLLGASKWLSPEWWSDESLHSTHSGIPCVVNSDNTWPHVWDLVRCPDGELRDDQCICDDNRILDRHNNGYYRCRSDNEKYIILCNENEYVQSNICVPCPSGLISPSGSDPSGADNLDICVSPPTTPAPTTPAPTTPAPTTPPPAATEGMIMRSDYNDALVKSVLYEGEPVVLTWEKQHELCAAAGEATPGSSHGSSGCKYSPTDNHVVTNQCNWSRAPFTHVSGDLGGGIGYMCTYNNCDYQMRVSGPNDQVHSYDAATLNNGDSVFCSATLTPTPTPATSSSPTPTPATSSSPTPTPTEYITLDQQICNLNQMEAYLECQELDEEETCNEECCTVISSTSEECIGEWVQCNPQCDWIDNECKLINDDGDDLYNICLNETEQNNCDNIDFCSWGSPPYYIPSGPIQTKIDDYPITMGYNSETDDPITLDAPNIFRNSIICNSIISNTFISGACPNTQEQQQGVDRCNNRGLCISVDDNRYTCSCNEGYTGATCENKINNPSIIENQSYIITPFFLPSTEPEESDSYSESDLLTDEDIYNNSCYYKLMVRNQEFFNKIIIDNTLNENSRHVLDNALFFNESAHRGGKPLDINYSSKERRYANNICNPNRATGILNWTSTDNFCKKEFHDFKKLNCANISTTECTNDKGTTTTSKNCIFSGSDNIPTEYADIYNSRTIDRCAGTATDTSATPDCFAVIPDADLSCPPGCDFIPKVSSARCSGVADDTSTTPDCAAAFERASDTLASSCPVGCDYSESPIDICHIDFTNIEYGINNQTNCENQYDGFSCEYNTNFEQMPGVGDGRHQSRGGFMPWFTGGGHGRRTGHSSTWQGAGTQTGDVMDEQCKSRCSSCNEAIILGGLLSIYNELPDTSAFKKGLILREQYANICSDIRINTMYYESDFNKGEGNSEYRNNIDLYVNKLFGEVEIDDNGERHGYFFTTVKNICDDDDDTENCTISNCDPSEAADDDDDDDSLLFFNYPNMLLRDSSGSTGYFNLKNEREFLLEHDNILITFDIDKEELQSNTNIDIIEDVEQVASNTNPIIQEWGEINTVKYLMSFFHRGMRPNLAIFSHASINNINGIGGITGIDNIIGDEEVSINNREDMGLPPGTSQMGAPDNLIPFDAILQKKFVLYIIENELILNTELVLFRILREWEYNYLIAKRNLEDVQMLFNYFELFDEGESCYLKNSIILNNRAIWDLNNNIKNDILTSKTEQEYPKSRPGYRAQELYALLSEATLRYATAYNKYTWLCQTRRVLNLFTELGTVPIILQFAITGGGIFELPGVTYYKMQKALNEKKKLEVMTKLANKGVMPKTIPDDLATAKKTFEKLDDKWKRSVFKNTNKKIASFPLKIEEIVSRRWNNIKSAISYQFGKFYANNPNLFNPNKFFKGILYNKNTRIGRLYLRKIKSYNNVSKHFGMLSNVKKYLSMGLGKFAKAGKWLLGGLYSGGSKLMKGLKGLGQILMTKFKMLGKPMVKFLASSFLAIGLLVFQGADCALEDLSPMNAWENGFENWNDDDIIWAQKNVIFDSSSHVLYNTADEMNRARAEFQYDEYDENGIQSDKSRLGIKNIENIEAQAQIRAGLRLAKAPADDGRTGSCLIKDDTKPNNNKVIKMGFNHEFADDGSKKLWNKSEDDCLDYGNVKNLIPSCVPKNNYQTCSARFARESWWCSDNYNSKEEYVDTVNECMKYINDSSCTADNKCKWTQLNYLSEENININTQNFEEPCERMDHGLFGEGDFLACTVGVKDIIMSCDGKTKWIKANIAKDIIDSLGRIWLAVQNWEFGKKTVEHLTNLFKIASDDIEKFIFDSFIKPQERGIICLDNPQLWDSRTRYHLNKLADFCPAINILKGSSPNWEFKNYLEEIDDEIPITQIRYINEDQIKYIPLFYTNKQDEVIWIPSGRQEINSQVLETNTKDEAYSQCADLCLSNDSCNSFYNYQTTYNFHENIIEFGNYPSDFQNSSLGCRNLSTEDAINLCNNTSDCDSFFKYDSENVSSTCFKNNIDITNEPKIHNDSRYPNSGMYVKKSEDDASEQSADEVESYHSICKLYSSYDKDEEYDIHTNKNSLFADIIKYTPNNTIINNMTDSNMHHTEFGYNGVPEYLRSINAINAELIAITVVSLETDYNFHENVLQFGNYPSDFQNSSLGCMNLSTEDAINLCNDTSDCDSFFKYDSENVSGTCFKNNIDITKEPEIHNDSRYPNSGMYVNFTHGDKITTLYIIQTTDENGNTIHKITYNNFELYDKDTYIATYDIGSGSSGEEIEYLQHVNQSDNTVTKYKIIDKIYIPEQPSYYRYGSGLCLKQEKCSDSEYNTHGDGNWDNRNWDSLSQQDKYDWYTLCWDEKRWDNIDPFYIPSHCISMDAEYYKWDELTELQQESAERLGYNSVSWSCTMSDEDFNIKKQCYEKRHELGDSPEDFPLKRYCYGGRARNYKIQCEGDYDNNSICNGPDKDHQQGRDTTNMDLTSVCSTEFDNCNSDSDCLEMVGQMDSCDHTDNCIDIENRCRLNNNCKSLIRCVSPDQAFDDGECYGSQTNWLGQPIDDEKTRYDDLSSQQQQLLNYCDHDLVGWGGTDIGCELEDLRNFFIPAANAFTEWTDSRTKIRVKFLDSLWNCPTCGPGHPVPWEPKPVQNTLIETDYTCNITIQDWWDVSNLRLDIDVGVTCPDLDNPTNPVYSFGYGKSDGITGTKAKNPTCLFSEIDYNNYLECMRQKNEEYLNTVEDFDMTFINQYGIPVDDVDSCTIKFYNDDNCGGVVKASYNYSDMTLSCSGAAAGENTNVCRSIEHSGALLDNRSDSFKLEGPCEGVRLYEDLDEEIPWTVRRPNQAMKLSYADKKMLTSSQTSPMWNGNYYAPPSTCHDLNWDLESDVERLEMDPPPALIESHYVISKNGICAEPYDYITSTDECLDAAIELQDKNVFNSSLKIGNTSNYISTSDLIQNSDGSYNDSNIPDGFIDDNPVNPHGCWWLALPTHNTIQINQNETGKTSTNGTSGNLWHNRRTVCAYNPNSGPSGNTNAEYFGTGDRWEAATKECANEHITFFEDDESINNYEVLVGSATIMAANSKEVPYRYWDRCRWSSGLTGLKSSTGGGLMSDCDTDADCSRDHAQQVDPWFSSSGIMYSKMQCSPHYSGGRMKKVCKIRSGESCENIESNGHISSHFLEGGDNTACHSGNCSAFGWYNYCT